MSHVIWNAFPQAFTFFIKFDSLFLERGGWGDSSHPLKELGMTPVIVIFSHLIIDEQTP
jgi:hypothetical protein